jgi:hypothetical protein
VQNHQATAPGDSPPLQAPAAIPMDFLFDPVSGLTCCIPRSPVEAGLRADEDPPVVLLRPPGQTLAVRLLGRMGACFGLRELTPSGAWRRIQVPCQDPWEPGARHNRSTIWHWWCP